MTTLFSITSTSPLENRVEHRLRLAGRMVVVALLAMALLFVGGTQIALAQDDAVLDLGKGVLNNVSNVESGQVFEYALSYSCSSVNTPCVNTVLVDTLPTCVEVVDVIETSHVADWSVSGNVLTVDFISPLPGGSSGIIRILVRFTPGTIPGDPCAETMPIPNNATIDADNAAPRDATAGITLDEGNFEMFAQKDQLNEAVVGEPITFELQLCSPDDIGGVPLTDPTFVDHLPPGATFVSATIEGLDPPDYVYDPDTNSVTWNNLPDPWPVGDCLTRQVTIVYNELPDPNVPQENELEVSGIPHGCEPGWTPQASYCDPDDPTVVLTDTNIFELELPFGRWGVGKSADSHSSYLGSEAIPGEQIDYTLAISNSGFLTVTNVVITDTLPTPQPGHTEGPVVFDQITFAPFTDSLFITAYYKLRGDPALVPFPLPGPLYFTSTTVTLADLNLPPSSDIELFRWEVPGNILPGSSWSAQMQATVRISAETNLLITNCLQISGDVIDTNEDPPVLTPLDGGDCANTEIIEARAIPRIDKERLGPAAVDPTAVVNYTVRVFNDSAANLDVVGPVAFDLLPQEVDYIPNSVQIVSVDPLTTPVPIALDVLNNFLGTGRTLLRASWADDALLPPGASVTLGYSVVIKEGTPPGDLINESDLLTNTPPEVTLGCQADRIYVDTRDLDQDGDATETGCRDFAMVTVNVQLNVDTRKYVRGQFESVFSDFGRSPEGGNFEYRIVLTNTSNVSLTDISLVDIFPWAGDRGVIDPGLRGSVFTPIPQTALGAANVPLTIWYSPSTNPCRPDLVPSLAAPPACEDPQWTLTYPIDPILGTPNPALVRAVRVNVCADEEHPEDPSNCYFLPRNQAFPLVWRMALPANEAGSEECLTDPVGPNCPVAWNSFGFRASGGGLPFRPSEPPKVGIAVTPHVDITIGDHVWLDVGDIPNNGIQGPTEQGYNGIRVLLFDADTMEVLDGAVTGADAFGRDGYYRFLLVDITPEDRFRVGFEVPAIGQPSPPLQGTNPLSDSNGITITVIPTIPFPFVLTDIISYTIGITEDLSIDQGFWAPLDFGDAPQGTINGVTYNYPTQVAGSVEVSRAARTSVALFPGITALLGAYVDDEADGQPNYAATGDDLANGVQHVNPTPDDEDGVRFPYTLDSPNGPLGILVRGANNSLVISATIDFNIPNQFPYLQAWIDFNRNWDWEYTSNERVIHNRIAVTGTQTVPIVVPSNAALGETWARFRLSRRPDLEPWGASAHGEVEDYRVEIIGPPVKSIVATSEAHTPASTQPNGNNTQVAIGEIVRYRLTGQLPRGILTNLRMVDALPNGLLYLGNPVVILTATTPSSITNAIFTPTVTPAVFASGTDVTFSFGDITNNSTGEGVEFVNLEFNALVLNEAGNQDNLPASSLRNNFTYAYGPYSAVSNNVDVAVVEPSLVLAKTSTATALLDGGDFITYTLDLSALPGGRRSTAFDTVISDTIDANLALVPGSIIVTTNPLTVAYTDSSSPAQINVTVPALKPGETVRVTYRTQLTENVRPGQVIPNRVTTEWTSLPGPNGTPGNPTGQVTPGLSGSSNGERNGSTLPSSLNNYFASDDEPVTVASPTFTKLQPPNPWTIGQPITFTLVVTTIEGTNPAVVVTDTLPPGLGYTGYSIVLDGFTGTFENNPPLVSPAAPASPPATALLSLNFGDIVSAGDNDPTNNHFRIIVSAVVLNILSNQHGVTMQNSAALAYTDAAGTRRVVSPPPVNVNLIEPTLQIEKSIDYLAPADAGDVVTYTVVVRHAPTSTIPAYNTLFVDTLPAELTGVTVITATGGVTNLTSTFAGGSLRVPAAGSIDLLPGEEMILVYTGIISDTVMPRTTFTNTAGVIWATLPEDGDPFGERRDDGLGTPDGQNLLNSGALDDYEVNDTALFEVDGSNAFTKLQPDNPWTIGQHLTFTLVITAFEGLSPDVIITDSLPAGLQYVNSTILTAATDSPLIPGDFNGVFSNPSPLPPVVVETGRDDPSTVTWTLGDLTNPGDNDLTNDTFVIEVEVVVLNILGNQHGVVRQNTARLTHTDGQGSLYILDAGPVDVQIVEPTLQITKSVDSPQPAGAGDVVTYTVVVRHAPTSTITAYDTLITDTLPSSLTSVQSLVVTTASGQTLGGSIVGNTVRVPALGLFDMAPTEVVTITYQATIGDADVPGQVITNTAGVIWASLDDSWPERRDDGVGNPDGEDLIDSDALDNYEANASAQVTFTAQPAFAKPAVDNPWTIGEYITFTLVVTTVQGTLPDVVVTDTLPSGLGFISQRIITSAAQSGGLLTQDFHGVFANTPPIVTPAPTDPPTTATVVWDFGDIVNTPDGIGGNETFLIQLQTVVLNVLPNQHGVTMQNSAAMAFTDGSGARVVLDAGPVDVDLIEPVLQITKGADFVEPFDSGDVVTYTITLRHAPTSTIPAYDTLITDTLAAELSNVVVQDARKNALPIITSVGAQGIRIPAVGTLTLYPTETITVVYTAILDDDAEAGVAFTNTVGAIWASLPDAFPQRRDDGVGNPDGLNLLDSGALDDYEVNATETVTPSVSYTITKALVSTSAAHTPGSDLTIGEVVTYSLRVTVSEGRIVRPVITDTLPAGLAWTGDWDADVSAFVGTINEPTVTGQPGVSGAPVVFAAGEQIVSGDNLTTTNTITLYLSAFVVDIPLNVGLPGNQTQLDNYATMTANNLPPVDTNIVTIQVVEPRMEITKIITPSISPPQGVVTVTIVVSNTGLSTAFESRMVDLLPPGLTYYGAINEVAGNGASPAVFTTAPDEITASWETFPVNTRSVIQFFAQLDAGLPSGTVIVNTATVSNASTLPGSDPNERTEPEAQASDDVTLVTHDLVLVKSVSSVGYRAGEPLTYTLVVTNVGQALAPGVYISDTVPEYTQFNSAINPNWYTATDFATQCADGAPAGTTCYYILGDLAPGESATVTFGVTVLAPLPDPAPTILNAACADDDGSLGIDPTPENNCDDVPSNFVLAQLGDRVWIDKNGNGIQETGELGYPGMTINLHRVGTLLPISTTTSGLLGQYHFLNLPPGAYFVEFVPMADPLITLQHEGIDPTIDSDADRVTGRTQEITLVAGEINNTIDAGVYYLSVIGDRVWRDLNANGVQDAGEPGIPNVTVSLLVQSSVVSTTTTNVNGLYFFTDLDFGIYSVRVDQVPGYFVSPLRTSGNDATDSDIDPVTRETRPLTITQSIVYLNFDAGFYPPSALGDYVWEDMNANGIQEAGEPPIALVGVQLLSGGSVLSNTITGADGLYLFKGLDVGEYVVRFVPLPGHVATLQNVGSNRAVDSDIDPTTHETPPISITVPITDLTWDAGFYRPITIGDFVWHDNNANGIQDAGEPGIADVAVTLLYSDGTPVATVSAAETIRTNGDGFYLFRDLPPGSYMVEVGRLDGMVHSPVMQGGDRTVDSDIDHETHRSGVVSLLSNQEDLTIDAGFFITAALGSYVWMDLNVDGVRDPVEPPVGGVTVLLLQPGRSTTVAETATDADGLFLFDHLPPGRYQLQFEAPPGLNFTWRDAVDDPMRNSDVNPGTGLTDFFDLAEGVSDLTWGAGLITPTDDPTAPEPEGNAFQLWLPAVQHQP